MKHRNGGFKEFTGRGHDEIKYSDFHINLQKCRVVSFLGLKMLLCHQKIQPSWKRDSQDSGIQSLVYLGTVSWISPLHFKQHPHKNTSLHNWESCHWGVVRPRDSACRLAYDVGTRVYLFGPGSLIPQACWLGTLMLIDYHCSVSLRDSAFVPSTCTAWAHTCSFISMTGNSGNSYRWVH